MTEKKKKVDVFIVTYSCDVCTKGSMISTGLSLTSYPPKYEHKCDTCECVGYFTCVYPKQMYEVESE